MRYETTSAQDGDLFWITMGPFFASRELRLEHGAPIEDDDYTWIVAFDGTGEVIGFAALDVNKAMVRHVHVLPDNRNHGIGHELVQLAMDEARGRGLETLKCVASPSSVSVFEDCGFGTVSMRGQYSVMEVQL